MNWPSAEAIIKRAITNLVQAQNPDGGISSYRAGQDVSGIWTTAFVVNTTKRHSIIPEEEAFIERCIDYIVACQNSDGGWPYKFGGISIVDTTSWALLALSHYPAYSTELVRGVDWLRQQRVMDPANGRVAWGLNGSEYCRTYSTYAAAYSLSKLCQGNALPNEMHVGIHTEVMEALDWLEESRSEGGWGARSGDKPELANTAYALICLLVHGREPERYQTALQWLLSQMSADGEFSPSAELVSVKEGYEFSIPYYSQPWVLRALIFFAELDQLDIEIVYRVGQCLLSHFDPAGYVHLAKGNQDQFTWPVAYAAEAMMKFRSFYRSRQREFEDLFKRQEDDRKRGIEERIRSEIKNNVPFPISNQYLMFSRENDSTQKFRRLNLIFEVTLKWTVSMLIAAYVHSRESEPNANAVLESGFARPSLGHWSSLVATLGRFDAVRHVFGADAAHDFFRPHRLIDESGRHSVIELCQHFVELRNRTVGHGALVSNYEYRILVAREEVYLYTLMNALRILRDTTSFLIMSADFDEFGGQENYMIRTVRGYDFSDQEFVSPQRLSQGSHEDIRYLHAHCSVSGTILNLYPFVYCGTCHECKMERFFFYNGVNSRRVIYISYDCGHTIEHDNLDHFRKRLERTGCAINWK